MNTRISILAAVLFCAAAPATAGDFPAITDAAACVSIRSATERLDCFDVAFSQLAMPADDKAVTVCIEAIRQTVISPASFRFVSASVKGNEIEVVFDAQNAYGALLRGTESCIFSLKPDGWQMAAPLALRLKAATFGPIAQAETKLDPQAVPPSSESAHLIKSPTVEEIKQQGAKRRDACAHALGEPIDEIEGDRQFDNQDGTWTVYLTRNDRTKSKASGRCDIAVNGDIKTKKLSD